MERQIVRVQNPMVLGTPEVHEMFRAAFATGKLDAEWNVDTALEMGQWILEPVNGVFFGFENGDLKGLAIGCLPTSKLLPIPAVYLFHNKGTKWLGRELARELVEFFRAAGYNRAWVVNRMTPNDKIFARWVSHVAKSEAVGSIVELNFS